MKHQFLNGDEIYLDAVAIKIKRKSNNPIVAIESYVHDVLIAAIADGFAAIESHDTRVGDIVMNDRTYRQSASVFRDAMSNEGALIHTSPYQVRMLWGANVWCRKDCPDNEIIVYEENSPHLSEDFPDISTK